MKVLILALGNDLLGDDGAALKTAEYLINQINNQNVDIIKTLKSGPALIDYLCSEYDHIIVLDTFIGRERGKIKKIDINMYKGRTSIPHFMGLPEIINFISQMGLKIPKIEIYCIEITDVKYGFTLSKEVEEAAKKLSHIITTKINEYFLSEGR